MVSYYDNRLQFNDFEFREKIENEDEVIVSEYIYFQTCLFINRENGEIGLDTRLHIEWGDEAHTIEGNLLSAWWDSNLMFVDKFAMQLRRFRGIVGKEIYKSVYFHKMYIDLLYPEQKKFLSHFKDIPYNLIKIRKNRTEIFLINCKEFDYVAEPTVGLTTRIDMETGLIISTVNYDQIVYHHKWLWVTDDYDGFNIQESKDRSEKWLKLNLNTHRIGRKKYWNEMLAKYNI